MEPDQQVVEFVLELLAFGGGGAAVAFLVFRFLGQSWIENRFAQSLERFRHQQALELQRLRVEIDSMLSGALKLQEKEFEVLPEAWHRLYEAYAHVSSLVSPAQSYPNLDKMTSDQLEEFLTGSELLNSQKDDVRKAPRKVEEYSNAIYWHRLHRVKQKCSALHDYVAREGIFLEPPLKSEFEVIAGELWDAVSSKEVGTEAGDYKLQHEGWKKIEDDVKPKFESVERKIHDRLRTHASSG